MQKRTRSKSQIISAQSMLKISNEECEQKAPYKHTPSILLSIKAERFFNAGVYGVLNDQVKKSL